jgi:hypothetical protein
LIAPWRTASADITVKIVVPLAASSVFAGFNSKNLLFIIKNEPKKFC